MILHQTTEMSDDILAKGTVLDYDRPDYSMITDRLWTGASISSIKMFEKMLSKGVTHIINAQSRFEYTSELGKIIASHPSINFCWNPTEDDNKPKPAQWFEKAITFAIPALMQKNTILYVHCLAGMNRGPSLAFAILRAFGFSYQDARMLIKRSRPIATMGYINDAEKALIELGWTLKNEKRD